MTNLFLLKARCCFIKRAKAQFIQSSPRTGFWIHEWGMQSTDGSKKVQSTDQYTYASASFPYINPNVNRDLWYPPLPRRLPPCMLHSWWALWGTTGRLSRGVLGSDLVGKQRPSDHPPRYMNLDRARELGPWSLAFIPDCLQAVTVKRAPGPVRLPAGMCARLGPLRVSARSLFGPLQIRKWHMYKKTNKRKKGA